MANRWQKGVIAIPKGKMTLEKLARMVQQGFTSLEESLNRRIDEVERRLSERLDRVEAEIAAVRRQLRQAVYQHEFDVLERRVEALEHKAGIRAK